MPGRIRTPKGPAHQSAVRASRAAARRSGPSGSSSTPRAPARQAAAVRRGDGRCSGLTAMTESVSNSEDSEDTWGDGVRMGVSGVGGGAR
ncbi:hypothetical protein SLNWT_5087 [Streptomyces albus]|uniref:Uncharacterized protein n=1 Tax=Streptomyces albus (strain ATCC 21838 / DSM 41398 / FERM P-419 / JCM 4703 / NBRC 107858) TaxID=1081613 RepID=A0A0B5ERL9_STRA4|nr:hypothetical protein SLNWT_5087 [Streptomyces albus]